MLLGQPADGLVRGREGDDARVGREITGQDPQEQGLRRTIAPPPRQRPRPGVRPLGRAY